MQVLDRPFISALEMRRPGKIPADQWTPDEWESTSMNDTCWEIESTETVIQVQITEDQIRNKLQNDLTLIRGIGPERAKVLRKKGFKTLKALKRTKWGQDAISVKELLDNGSVAEIFSYYQEIGRGTEPLLIGFGAAAEKEKLLFYDIETLGMTHSPIILFGCGLYHADKLTITQYLLRDPGEESVTLKLIANLIKKHPIPVTYNGKSFDIPYTNNRLDYHREQELMIEYQIDLLHPVRRMFKNNLPNCCLGTVEEHILNIPRKEDLPGYLVPIYYQKYLSTNNPDYLLPIVTHNRQDVATLANLLAKQTGLLYAT